VGEVAIKRVYEPPSEEDGRRYLVDRLWPRGVTKKAAALAGWLKDAAPSVELRLWYGHDSVRYEEFRRRYYAELLTRPEIIRFLREEARSGKLTLVFAAKDGAHSHAQALKDFLDAEIKA
jgi:uncharacterized protein YeaO (DUF488 family)